MDWKKEVIYCSVIYKILEKNEKIPYLTFGDDYAFIEKELKEMTSLGLLDNSEEYYQVTQKGVELRNKIVELYDHALRFDIFASFNLTINMDDYDSESDECDPRFLDPQDDFEADKWGNEDLRLAMYGFINEILNKEIKIDPHRIVFIQMLANNRLSDDRFWIELKLGTVFKEIEEIVDSAYKWTDVADAKEEAIEVMHEIYSLGMLEQQRRDALYEEEEQSEEEEFYEEEVVEEEIIEEEVFSGYESYGYEPYGYYNPYDPFLDVAAFGILCAALW